MRRPDVSRRARDRASPVRCKTASSNSSTSPTARRSSRCRGPRRSEFSPSSRDRLRAARSILHRARPCSTRCRSLVARTGYTGEDGVEILCHVSQGRWIWRALLSFPEVTPCGLGARDTLRLEMGYPLHGTDMDRGVDPISAGSGLGRSLETRASSSATTRSRASGNRARLASWSASMVDGRHSSARIPRVARRHRGG